MPPDHEYQTSTLIDELRDQPDDGGLWARVIADGVIVCQIDGDTFSVSTECEQIDEVRRWVRGALESSTFLVEWE
jgi:hypothetical protein